MPRESGTWWSRLTERFGRKNGGAGTPPELPEVGDDGLLLDGAQLPDGAGDDAEVMSERSGNPLVRWSKREQTLSRLQEGYERLNGVIEEIQKHLAQQGERTERICTALEQLARSTADMSTLSRHHAETLESIAGHIEVGNARLGQVVDSVGEIPKAARVQTEAIHGIRKQMEMAGEQNLVTSQTMEKLSTAISALGEANATQVEALHQMNRKADDQTERLGKLIARQNKRFVMLFVVTIVLAVAAITAAIVGLALR